MVVALLREVRRGRELLAGHVDVIVERVGMFIYSSVVATLFGVRIFCICVSSCQYSNSWGVCRGIGYTYTKEQTTPDKSDDYFQGQGIGKGVPQLFRFKG